MACNRSIPEAVRTDDQMVQAARSGRQNFVEGRQASGNFMELRVEVFRPIGPIPE